MYLCCCNWHAFYVEFGPGPLFDVTILYLVQTCLRQFSSFSIHKRLSFPCYFAEDATSSLILCSVRCIRMRTLVYVLWILKCVKVVYFTSKNQSPENFFNPRGSYKSIVSLELCYKCRLYVQVLVSVLSSDRINWYLIIFLLLSLLRTLVSWVMEKDSGNQLSKRTSKNTSKMFNIQSDSSIKFNLYLFYILRRK